MASPNIIRVGGIAAMLAGVTWLMDALLIALQGGSNNAAFAPLSTLLFFTAPLFAALGLVGLRARLADQGGRLARVGGVLAYIGVLGSAINVGYFVYIVYIVNAGRGGIELGGPMTLGVAGTIIGLLGSAIVLGIATLRVTVLPPWANMLPLVLGILSIPGFILLQILMNLVLPTAASGELPTLVIGIAWLALGYAILTGNPTQVRSSLAAR